MNNLMNVLLRASIAAVLVYVVMRVVRMLEERKGK